MSDLVSIIVPIYGVEEYLSKCIDSIINQTYKNLEIILVDDGSLDGCPLLCDKWAEQDKRIRVVHQANSGLSAARNTGLEMMSGEYIAFVDSDDYLDSRYVDSMLSAIISGKWKDSIWRASMWCITRLFPDLPNRCINGLPEIGMANFSISDWQSWEAPQPISRRTKKAGRFVRFSGTMAGRKGIP